ncbi:MAG TPA: hypothetical protein VHG28_13605 [Longimicrobiaceae bacterium]|nr:hypothetical protein [Longimicrobiaceae bacterium]
MSPEPAAPCRTLGEYVAELVRRLGEADPIALARLSEVVGGRSARIALDAEAVRVRFAGGRLLLRRAGRRDRCDGEGAADRACTLDLLDGYTDSTSALLEGRLEARGELDALTRIFQAIEILLDGSSRTPMLQALARDYRADPCRPSPATLLPRREHLAEIYPDEANAAENALLARLDLLPDAPA